MTNNLGHNRKLDYRNKLIKQYIVLQKMHVIKRTQKFYRKKNKMHKNTRTPEQKGACRRSSHSHSGSACKNNTTWNHWLKKAISNIAQLNERFFSKFIDIKWRKGKAYWKHYLYRRKKWRVKILIQVNSYKF